MVEQHLGAGAGPGRRCPGRDRRQRRKPPNFSAPIRLISLQPSPGSILTLLIPCAVDSGHLAQPGNQRLRPRIRRGWSLAHHRRVSSTSHSLLQLQLPLHSPQVLMTPHGQRAALAPEAQGLSLLAPEHSARHSGHGCGERKGAQGRAGSGCLASSSTCCLQLAEVPRVGL